jgi:sigma-B regulation protein RsbU (phosphoserine phosphatase)
MKATLSTRLIVWVGVPAALLFATVLWLSSLRSTRRVIAETESRARATARFYAARLDGQLKAAAEIPAMHARAVESGAFDTKAKLENFLREVVEKNPQIYGSCIVFKPYSFDPAEYGYGPYYYRTDHSLEFVQLAAPDYNYFQWAWYREPRDLGAAIWTEPYFDDGGGNVLMTTRSVPFRRDDAFWGVATIDIALTQLMDETKQLDLGQTGYAFIISKSGRFLAYPDTSKVMKAMLQDVSPALAGMMRNGEEGFHEMRDPLRSEDAWIAFAPVEAGNLALALIYPKKEVLAEAFGLQKEQLALGVLGLIGLFGALIFVARSVSKPIRQLAQAAQLVADGDLEQRLSATAPTEEVRNLMNAFNKMTRDLQMRMQELRYTTTVKERFEGELNAARSIQMSLVPKNFPAFPGRPEFDVHALLRPAREIGGDLYDFYFLDEDWLCFLIGDVSGKGVPAALFMAVTKTLLKASSSRRIPMAKLMQQVNDELCEQTDSGMFVSLLYGHLHTKTGELEFTNAGHPAPYIIGTDGRVRALDGEKDVAVGAMTGLEYHSTSLRLAPGDTLFLFTDGVPEALDRSEHFYGNTRLEIVLHDLAALPVEKITRGVVRDVRTFCGEREQSDDISVMTVRWLGTPSSPSLS